jgi:hypothetical protein
VWNSKDRNIDTALLIYIKPRKVMFEACDEHPTYGGMWGGFREIGVSGIHLKSPTTSPEFRNEMNLEQWQTSAP